MKTLRKFHKWPSLIVGLFIILFCLSGVIMNHRDFFSPFDFPRYLLPSDYKYYNWNLASVKGFLKLNNHEQLAYGNVGIWKTDMNLETFKDFNNGFPKGSAHRKIFTMIKTSDGSIFAGTLFSLYKYNTSEQKWVEINLPVKNPRTVKLLEKDGNLIILTRSELITMNLVGQTSFTKIEVPATENHSGESSLFRTLWVIHSGEIIGFGGKIVVDLLGISVIFIVLSGFFYSFLPTFTKRVKETTKKKLKIFNKHSIKWHTWIGLVGLPIFLITTITGMFLRPPLLIPIANKYVKSIPGTELSHENVWYKKFRDVIIDTATNDYIISTSEGFIRLETTDHGNITSFMQVQPPVSVMGINAFEDLGKGNFLVASFSGIYNWNIHENHVTDMITGMPASHSTGGNPFGSIAVAGVYMNDNIPAAVLDYEAGWVNLTPGTKPEMPKIISSQPISLWNLALEVHTGRIFNFLFGDFYILYVPLMGIAILVICITGFFMWLKPRSAKSKKKSHASNKITTSTISSPKT